VEIVDLVKWDLVADILASGAAYAIQDPLFYLAEAITVFAVMAE